MIDDFKMPPERPDASRAPETTPSPAAPETLPPLDFTEVNPDAAPILPAPQIDDEVDQGKITDMMGESDSPEDFQSSKPKKPTLLRLPQFSWWHRLSKRQRIMVISAGVLLFSISAGTGAFLFMHNRKPKAVAAVATPKKKAPVDNRVPSALTGLLVDPALNQRPVTAVMIENSTDARPQSGLDQAGVVFEAIAEGGITRFMALYQETQPDYVGPVRSVRPYFLHWAMGFDAPIAHVGGSPEALQNIKDWGTKDLDQFFNSGAYHRVSSRYAPHNMYTSLGALAEVEAAKGFTSSDFKSFTRKKEQPYKATATGSKADTRSAASAINLNISSRAFNVAYTYEPDSNSYKRNMDGQAHMSVAKDGTQTQITPKVVIALVMPYGIQNDGKHSDYGTVGTGQMFVFQDGIVTQGTWSKADKSAQFVFSDSEGHPLTLNPGQTWISLLNTPAAVTYQ
jgi:hypothetical protein